MPFAAQINPAAPARRGTRSIGAANTDGMPIHRKRPPPLAPAAALRSPTEPCWLRQSGFNLYARHARKELIPPRRPAAARGSVAELCDLSVAPPRPPPRRATVVLQADLLLKEEIKLT